MDLVEPSLQHLPQYRAALELGWSADNVRGAAAAREELDTIAADAVAFLDIVNGRAGLDRPVTLPDGTEVPRLPGYRLWMWDGEFCGSIGFRWQPGTAQLPNHVLGHIGYAVVPWKRRKGHATRALALLLPRARALGLPWVELTTDPDNLESQKVITANGGFLRERFRKESHYGGGDALRFRIVLDDEARQ